MQVQQSEPGGRQLPAGKRPYRKPALRVYGRLVQWTQGTGGGGRDAGGAMTRMSDRRAKTNAIRVGEHPLGIGLYLFDFKPQLRERWGGDRQLGVMADEVERVLPQAVSVDAGGYRTVDYAMLGFRFGPR